MNENATPDEIVPATTLVRGGAQLVQVENETIRAIALARPRDPQEVLAQALAQLEMFPAFAAASYYSIPFKDHIVGCKDRKGCTCPETRVEGPSVQAARAIAQLWGNLSVSSGRILSEDENTYTVEAVAIDMETGYRKSRCMPISKYGYLRGGATYRLSEDKLAKALGREAAKAERNVIFDVIPYPLRIAYYERAREIATGRTKSSRGMFDPIKKAPEIEEAFAKLGISGPQLTAYLGHAIELITRDEAADLLGIRNAIRDGEVDAETVFGAAEVVTCAPIVDKPDDIATLRIRLRNELMKVVDSDEKRAHALLKRITAEGASFRGYWSITQIDSIRVLEVALERLALLVAEGDLEEEKE